MNIQQTIIEGLKVQLYLHEFIVLPDFGGFVLKQRPAHFNATRTQLVPPSKTVSFNGQLRQNDGIMSAWLHKKTGCRSEDALRHLVDFAGYCRGMLENKRRLTLPGIGFFHLDFEGNIGFEPQPDLNFLTESFGLSAVNVGGQEKNAHVQRKKPVFVDRLLPDISKKKSAPRRVGEIILPALLVVMLGLLIAMLVSVRTFRGELRSAIYGSSGSGKYSPISYPPLDDLETGGEPVALHNDDERTALIQFRNTCIPVKLNGDDQGYEIVLGCFSVPGNAEKMLRQLRQKNISAKISPRLHKGMVVVTYGEYAGKAAAIQQLSPVKQTIPTAWLRPF